MSSPRLTPVSLALFLAYARDAGNWSGQPLVGGNVGGSKEDRGNLTQLKRAKLITTVTDEGCTWINFTDAGKALAREHGVDGFAEPRPPAISGEAFSGRVVKAILPLFALAIMLHMGHAIAAPAPEPLTPPSCSSDRQCVAMWAAARDWVASSCGMKIQTITDGFIETYGPRDGNAYCRVWRDPLPAGGYTFHAKVDYGAPFMGKYMRQMLEGLVAALNSTAAAFK